MKNGSHTKGGNPVDASDLGDGVNLECMIARYNGGGAEDAGLAAGGGGGDDDGDMDVDGEDSSGVRVAETEFF